jgi:prepilin-type N-terminal cleavage/methylation domain-containing protein
MKKKAINMRSGFTMIELVFVIVIIGILSAVALPKFLETSNQAHDAAVKSFAGTLNRTTGPTIWSKSISDGNSGAISTYCATIGNYVDIPDELTDNGDCTFSAKAGSGATLNITFTDGDATKAPAWVAS